MARLSPRSIVTRLTAASCLLATGLTSSLLAQSGDRPNDPQRPPPDHWVIPPAPALSVEEALKTFDLPAGYKIEVVAADPLLFDPVAIQVGPDGRIWVVEMRGYMPDVEGNGEDQPVGTIAVLTDTDGDGRMDKRSEFASGLVMPRALALVGDGLLVAAPPYLWHYRDTDGDEVSDERTVVSDNYGDDINPEHTANGLMWGHDNWIYNANHTERFRYRDGEWETAPAPSRGQWGMTQDDRGRIFYNSNSNPLRGDLFPGRYLLRNPDLVGAKVTNFEFAPSASVPVFPGRITPGVNRGYKILTDDGYITTVTAACGPVIYRSNLFGAEVYGDVFVAEPSGNLVKQIRLQETDDGGLVGTNVYEEDEILTSTDERFRPVNLYNGPDGALYIVDMYRGILQHRIFVTTFLRNQIKDRGLEKPLGMGRIYRIVPEHYSPTPTPNLATASSADLAIALAHPDAWRRETAQRLLVERADASIAPALRQHIKVHTGPGRINALWTLQSLGELDEATLLSALGSFDIDLVINALQAAEPHLTANHDAIVRATASTANHESAAVRRQAALSIAYAPAEVAVHALVHFAAHDDKVVGMDAAIVSGLRHQELALIESLAAHNTLGSARRTATMAAAAIVSRRDPAELNALFAHLEKTDPKSDLATVIIAGLEKNSAGKKGERQRIKLPIEPTALAAFAAKATGKQQTELNELLGLIDGPKAQSQVAKVIPLTAAEQLQFDQGKTTFALCAGCHQPTGMGLPGLAPALVGSRWATGDPEIAAAIVLKGKEGNGLVMPPLEALDDHNLANALTYVRRSWGHTASAVSPEHIAQARKTHATRATPWTDADLEKLK
jgi:glucose/arabinose dehydrogenase/mono/diheme cytochrome c family protein